MKRRTLLGRAGALGAFLLAGCVGDGTDPGANGTPDETPTDSPTPTPTSDEPTITDQTITTVQSGCHSGDSREHARASFDTDAETVTVSGLLQTSTPCYEAALEAVGYDDATDTLSVDVTATSTDEMCVDCVGAVEYEATVSFTGGTPGTVSVSHQGEGVATAGHGETMATPDETSTPTEEQSTGTPTSAPTVVESSLSVVDVSQRDQRETAEPSFDPDANTVVIEGTIQGSDSCKTAALGSLSVDADRLTVDVVTENREGTDNQVCAQALVHIDYRATITFENGIPTEVAVSHDGDGIASGGYSSASAGDA